MKSKVGGDSISQTATEMCDLLSHFARGRDASNHRAYLSGRRLCHFFTELVTENLNWCLGIKLDLLHHYAPAIRSSK